MMESRESFDRIHDTSLNLAPAGENPPVVWRGDWANLGRASSWRSWRLGVGASSEV